MSSFQLINKLYILVYFQCLIIELLFGIPSFLPQPRNSICILHLSRHPTR
uniref:Uncharacterized protein n=1 Tax=Arundo donax TaxID=35708 RepID=A0A0A8YW10_ARUDO